MERKDTTSLGAAEDYPATHSLGNLGLTLTDAGIGQLTWHGVELLRGTTFPIRDADWGSVPATITSAETSQTGDTLAHTRHITAWDGAITGTFTLTADASGKIEVHLTFEVKRAVTVCRAGFTLLHPIIGLAGEALRVTHDDGSVEDTTFPEQISPSQPARGIAGLSYAINGCAIDIAFAGDIFEMEDQRNWSDASYKTYCRPLSLPNPYGLDAGETITQSVTIRLGGQPARAPAASDAASTAAIATTPSGEAMPAVALALEAGWARDLPPAVADVPNVIRLDLNDHDGTALLAGRTTPLDLELITSDDLEVARDQLTRLARNLEAAGLNAGHLIATPRAYLKSHQPDSVWPAGAAPADLIGAARTIFPDARIGGGMLTNFTELNRHRPDPAQIDFIAHGSSAIVHAADDESVFQTIEALPQIFASARAIAPQTAYRLGLISIGMRTNPYGDGLVDNPEGNRRTTTADDPRARTRAGAAWMLAAMGATRGFGIERIVLAAPGGPFGIMASDTDRVRPSYHVVRALHAMSGLPRTDLATAATPLAIVSAQDGGTIRAIVANLGTDAVTLAVSPGASAAILDAASESDATDPNWLDTATAPCSDSLPLSGHAMAFVSIPSTGRTAA